MLAFLLLLILVAIAAGVVLLLILFVDTSRDLPSISDIANFSPEESTQIYYSDTGPDGKPLLMAALAAANRRPVKLEQMSPYLRDAIVAIEDTRFRQHRGVDYIGIGRALFRNLTGGNLKGEGGSTITQQLARNISSLGLTRQKLLDRKVAEAILARRIEELFDKDEILELYLNTIYFGNGAYGAEAASRAYFRKSAAKLTLSEAAFLAGLPQRPVYYSNHRDAAMKRRDVVLDRMLELKMIGRAEHDDAVLERLDPKRVVVTGNRVMGAHHFVDYVVKHLTQLYGADKTRSGLRVYTTLDSRMQKLAEDAVRSGVRRSSYATQCGLICIENRTGRIRAMVGGMDYDRDQFNTVTQGARQPGSAFKPIVYTAAIDTGKCDLNSRYRDDGNYPWRGRDKWLPQNYGGSFSHASVTVRDAIRRSLNSVAVKVAYETGVLTIIDYARKMGITTDLAPYLPLALGASAVRPIELCSAYTVFANQGKRAVPTPVFRVLERNGVLLDEFGSQTEETGIRLGTLQQMDEALREVVLRGTATGAASVPDAHGKTGTTSDNRDAWFVGYTPELTTAIWVAREERLPNGRVRYREMPGMTGGRLCVPIWAAFMGKAVPLQREAEREQAERAATETPPPKKDKALEETEPLAKEPGVQGEPAPETGTGAEVAPPIQGDERIDEPPPLEPVNERPAPPPPATPPERAQPPPRVNPRDEQVRVRICAETMRKATDYCPVTIERSMPRRDVPGECRRHRPPPGEDR
ncbi:MAG: PBP1A family penicillin-binding protein [Chthonomonadales bacterium]|nr:PBP1A family penicillin-binding protein [Chthonomonadales bacterium]